jgi:hypothetical protein
VSINKHKHAEKDYCVKLTCTGEFAVTLEAREAPTQEMCRQIAALCVGDTSSCHCGVITLIDVCKNKREGLLKTEIPTRK